MTSTTTDFYECPWCGSSIETIVSVVGFTLILRCSRGHVWKYVLQPNHASTSDEASAT